MNIVVFLLMLIFHHLKELGNRYLDKNFKFIELFLIESIINNNKNGLLYFLGNCLSVKLKIHS
jgi:hypothetical protein